MPSGRASSTGRAATRSAEQSGLAARLQAIVVLFIAATPLTAAGHYFANRATGDVVDPTFASLVWLPVFVVVGLALVMAGLATLAPGWHKGGGRAAVLQLLAGLVIATVDWSHLVDSLSGLALNFAGAGLAVAGLLGAIANQRMRVTRIATRGGERVTEWFAATIAFAGGLAFVLPFETTISGHPTDCSPMWLALEVACWTPDTIWWPIPAAAIVVGLTMLTVLRTDPAVYNP